MSRLISFAVLIAIIIVIGLLFYKVLIGFFIPVFLAAVLVVVFRPAHRWVLEKTGHRDQLAAALTTALIVLTLFLPIAVIFGAAAVQGLALTSKNGQDVISVRIKTIRSKLGLNMPSYIEELRSAETEIQEIVQLSNKTEVNQSALINQSRKARRSVLELRNKVEPEEAGQSQLQSEDDISAEPSEPDDEPDLADGSLRTIDASSSERASAAGFDSESAVAAPESDAAPKSNADTDSNADTNSDSDVDKDSSSEDEPPADDEASLTESFGSGFSLGFSEESPEEKSTRLFDELLTLIDSIDEALENDEDPASYSGHSAVEIKSKFVDLKTQLMGGTIMSFAKETANPTAELQEEWTNSIVNYVQPRLLSITGATGTFIVKLVFGGVILIVATFFFLYDGPAMLSTIMRLSPLDDAYEQELLLEFDRVSRAVVVATLLSAVVQGLTAGLGYAVAGMDFLILLIMLTTVFAMVPFVGPAVIWVPVCLYIGVYEGRYLAASLLALWGVLVVGTVDNVVKAFVLHGQSQLHPLLALLSVLGGVQTLGPIGIVVGPMVVVMLQTLLSILQRELMHFDKQNLVVSTQGLSVAAPMTDPVIAPGGQRVSKRKSRRAAEEADRQDSESSADGMDERSDVTSDDAGSNSNQETGRPSNSKSRRRRSRRKKLSRSEGTNTEEQSGGDNGTRPHEESVDKPNLSDQSDA